MNYLTPAIAKWHLSDAQHRMYLTREGGEKVAMPRYYKDKIYNRVIFTVIPDWETITPNYPHSDYLCPVRYQKTIDTTLRKAIGFATRTKMLETPDKQTPLEKFYSHKAAFSNMQKQIKNDKL